MSQLEGRLLSLDDNQILRSIQILSGQKLVIGMNGVVIATNQDLSQNSVILCEIIYEYGQMHIQTFFQEGLYLNNQKLGLNNRIIIQSGDILRFEANRVTFEYVYVIEAKKQNRPAEEVQNQQRPQKFAIEEELQCPICFDIYFQPVILHRCGHIFCGACVSIWEQNSSKCPSCRRTISQVTNATTLNSLLDRYLQANPNKAKSEEDKLYYQQNNNYLNVVQNQPQQSSLSNSMEIESISDDSSGRSDQSESIILTQAINTFQEISDAFRTQATIVSNLIDQRNNSRYPLIDCQSCHGATYNGFTCTLQTQHVFCTACNQRKMPLKQLTYQENQQQKMHCQICSQYYCYYYYGFNCRKMQRVFLVLDKWRNKLYRDENYILRTEYVRLLVHGASNQYIFNYVMQNIVNYGRFHFRRSFVKPEDRHNLVESTLLLPTTPICLKCFKFVMTQIIIAYVDSVKQNERQFQKQNCIDGIICRQQSDLAHSYGYNHLCGPQQHYIQLQL
ncbi:hypothetical protein pb186bvf_011617 [Paramecium bursaria]